MSHLKKIIQPHPPNNYLSFLHLWLNKSFLMKIYRNMKVQQLVHVAYERTPTLVGVRMILDMRPLIRTLIFPLLFFQIFKNFLILIILFCLKT